MEDCIWSIDIESYLKYFIDIFCSIETKCNQLVIMSILFILVLWHSPFCSVNLIFFIKFQVNYLWNKHRTRKYISFISIYIFDDEHSILYNKNLLSTSVWNFRRCYCCLYVYKNKSLVYFVMPQICCKVNIII